jgi:aldehyde:ferredoxin oxidoreductase
VTAQFIKAVGLETLQLEREFNQLAGFTEIDDELPAFFQTEPLPPTNKKTRLTSTEVNAHYNKLLQGEISI